MCIRDSKSTVLRIMAGVDKEYEGEVQWQPGISIGYLPQEPQLDANKTVREEVESEMCIRDRCFGLFVCIYVRVMIAIDRCN